MEFLWAKWKTLNATNSLSLQRLTEESSHALRANSTYMLSAGDDFVYMYVGETIQAIIRFNPTGKLLSTSESPVARDLLGVYRQASKTLMPSFVRFSSARNSRQIWQGLVLPVRLAPGTVLLVCYTELISHQSEVWEHLFQTSRDPMLIASPISNEMAEVVDGWVVMMNDAARDFLGFHDATGNLRLKQLERLQTLDLRFRLQPPVPAGTVIAAAGAGISAEIIRFAHVFALRLDTRGALGRSDDRIDAPELAPA
jgi:PAS domain-containing protein